MCSLDVCPSCLFINPLSTCPHSDQTFKRYIPMKKRLSLFLPWPSQKTEPQVLCLFFFLSNIHNMFRHCALITWYLTKNWQKYWQKHAKDHKTSTLYFHFLRQLARESESRAQRGSGKNLHPSGVSPFSLWPTLPLLPRPQAPPCWVWWLLHWHEVRPRARTPPTTWV